ncbi:FKBP12-associated protein 1 homolog [Phanerochaete sordida]|uniref:FKBP12-associated protein 1 homolog n=1 Tax=Phanerochaete sordida TaxID=48140 RepID=A0A9P3LFX9_9APHY|nr:FKBP12-associated protein 1 homolog [Phanerochaete sordida]
MSTATAGASAPSAAAGPAASNSRPPRRRHPRPRPANPEENDALAGPSSSGKGPGNKGQSRRRRPRPDDKAAGDEKSAAGEKERESTGEKSQASSTAGDAQGARQNKRPPRPREPRKPAYDAPPHAASPDPHADKQPGARARRRAPKFDGGLTDPARAPDAPPHEPAGARYRRALPTADDLTSRLTRELSVPPYPDCLICFAPIHAAQPTWSCSPLLPSAGADDEGAGAESAQCCWTTFHLKCIRAWAAKSVKDVEEAWRARGEERTGAWRCPGCQSKRAAVPASYWCFCGSTPDPKPPRLATPHSCAGPCTRARTCGHPCPLPCHPGPCPPCQVTIQVPCFCSKQVLSFRCANLAPSRAGVPASPSCGQVCGKQLACGNHSCTEICHEGPCKPCEVKVQARCYCGKAARELACGEGEEKTSVVVDDGAEQQWTGLFECENLCDRPFDCGLHRCEQPCHVPSRTPAPCPRSPSIVKTCPCGKHALEPPSAPFFSAKAKLVRTVCTDPIPTCESLCMKPLEGCEHLCAVKCHTGPCPPCSINLVRPCRCGSTTRNVPCHEDQKRAEGALEEILCDRLCTALRACGRHQCSRACCPLASLANANKGKGKKRAVDNGAFVDEAGWHECDLICGKPLACGNHTCELRDHKGPCPSCLRSSFVELVCHCGRTVLDPPIPCGTRISCRYPCDRPLLPCGHPKTQHACHEDPTPCPPCPFLTSKQCACGKKMVGNIKCSQETVSCGTKCGKLLSCGFHQCDRLCHGDACGACHAVCGKSRKLCLPANHPCTLPCHAPASCSEAEPCRTPITITCACGRIRQSVPCGRSTANPAGREGSQQLKCTNDCALAKRNARLAEALGINPEGRSFQVSYSDDLQAFARANLRFCLLVEKTFADFVASDKRSQILPHMPEARRRFVHDLAAAYRMDTQMVDQEPHRSVQLFRRADTRVPAPLLSASVAQSAQAPPSLGKLADLRAPVAQLARASAGPARAAPAPQQPGARGWTSVVARPSSAQQTAPDPHAWLLGGGDRAGSPAASSSTAAPPARPRAAPSPAPVYVPPAAPADPGDVPDNWEDEA